ncbi:MAG: GDP-fucose synthetase [Candidatus Pelagibacter sp.]|nr:GDP-fucose synthetase [Candidatus Pelagibacter sp.]
MKTRIFVAGHKGMVGSAIVRQLSKESDINLLLASKSELDLRDYSAVEEFMQQHKPDQVYFAAARVGGIHANNTYPADFIIDNLVIQTNVIQAAYNAGVHKLLFLGSSCIYPQLSKQPITEDSLLTGTLEPTNEPYAIAKIAGIKMCESYNRQYGVDYRCVMPTNLYGENDNFHPLNAHVIPAMMQRFHKAKIATENKVVVWGTGKPMREFLHVSDMAAGCIYVMNLPHPEFIATVPKPMCSHINVGTGRDVTILELANTMARVVGFKGDIEFDVSKPDGTPRKLLNVSRLKSLGWSYTVDLEQGLEMTYDWFLENLATLRS